MNSAQQIAELNGNVVNSVVTLATNNINGIEYDFRVCGSGPEAYFEWINDEGDPIGEILNTITSVEAETAHFEAWRLLADAYSDSDEKNGSNGKLLSFDEWTAKAATNSAHPWHTQAKVYVAT